MVSIRRTVVGVAVAGAVFWVVGMDLPAGIVAAFAFVLVLLTTSSTVVVAGVAAAALFFAGELIVEGLQLVFPDPRFSYAIVFVIGLVAGKLEDRVIRKLFD